MLMLTFARRTVESVVRLYVRARTLQELRSISPRLLADVGINADNLDTILDRASASSSVNKQPLDFDVTTSTLAPVAG